MTFLFLSQVVGRQVYNSDGERVARVKDIVARLEAPDARGEVALEQFPSVSGLVVDIEKRDIFIPWGRISTVTSSGAQFKGSSITMQSFLRREGEVLLARDVLDKQLIDIDGRRVVRANDLQLFSAEGR